MRFGNSAVDKEIYIFFVIKEFNLTTYKIAKNEIWSLQTIFLKSLA